MTSLSPQQPVRTLMHRYAAGNLPSPLRHSGEMSLRPLRPSGGVSYRGVRILDRKEKAEMIGYKVKSLLGALPAGEDEEYMSILEDRGKGHFTGETKNDISGVGEPDRLDISCDIKQCMKKRNPLNAARSPKCVDGEESFGGALPAPTRMFM